jgi:multisubunit Na+/H+ antiporter MnhG subunit
MGWVFIVLGATTLAVAVIGWRRSTPMRQRLHGMVRLQAVASGLSFISIGVANLVDGVGRTIAFVLAVVFFLGNGVAWFATVREGRDLVPRA